MKEKTSKPSYKLVYSLGEHPYLGYLIEPHIVFLNQNGSYSLSSKRVFSNTVKEFASALDKVDYELIQLLDEIEQTQLIKRFHKQNIRPADFFARVFNETIFEYLRPKIEQRLIQFLAKVGDKPLFLMGGDGYPADSEIKIAEHKTSILFHFRRNETETRYFPTLKYDGHRMEFMYKGAEVIINQQAWLLLEGVLYHFDQELEGKKLTPFLNKRFVSIPRNTEKKYFSRFVKGLIEKHHVYAEGLDIVKYRDNPEAELSLTENANKEVSMQLNFRYGEYVLPSPATHEIAVKYKYDTLNDVHHFYRITRAIKWEMQKEDELLALGLRKESALFNFYSPAPNAAGIKPSSLEWLTQMFPLLEKNNFKVLQNGTEDKYFFGESSISMEVSEKNDWFDVKAIVSFGEFQIPFASLRNHILNKEQKFMLPNGEIAIIPLEWFARYEHLFQFSIKKDQIRLNQSHFALLGELSEYTDVTMKHKLSKLVDFEKIHEVDVPKGFKGSLREYQKAGYNWFHFLKKYRFGGLLADDMGLGKTIQTLAILQYEKENPSEDSPKTSLLIVPTSLIFNWQKEAEQFVPDLKILLHTGTNRNKENTDFSKYDLVITTYGITRIDQQILASTYFNYIILDESQNIKNPRSKAFISIRGIDSKLKLALSGTPIENGVLDIWSQMQFANPGLLGSYPFFQKEFVLEIEKKKKDSKAQRLQSLIKPFILRRTKSQVATELPPKTEQIFYCNMAERQSEYYEEKKSEYRNAIISEQAKPHELQLMLLRGLMKLRQLANHPAMIDEDYTGGSGKFEAAIELLKSIIEEGNKVLIFSSFVKHLQIFKEYFDKEKIGYAYLDGGTIKREKVVKEFKENQHIKTFLISIKAGGVGLNLTEADYVFILDPWWNPAVEQQAVDRTHRIGQKKNVFVYKFISKDSIEEKILSLQNRKKVLASQLITTEESFMKSLNKDDIKELFA